MRRRRGGQEIVCGSVIEILWEILWPIALYEGITGICGLALPSRQELVVQTVSAGILVGIWGILSRRNRVSGQTLKGERLFRTAVLLGVAGISASLFFNGLIQFSGLKERFAGFQKTAAVLAAPPLWVRVLSMGIVIPGAEELIFRGLVYKALRKRYTFYIAAFVSSVLFGVYHGSLVQGVYAWAIGMVLAFFYERYQSVLAVWTIHGFANLTSVLAGGFIRTGKAATILSGVCPLIVIYKMKSRNQKEVIP